MVCSALERALDWPDRPVRHRYDDFEKSYISSDTSHVSTYLYDYDPLYTLIEQVVSDVSFRAPSGHVVGFWSMDTFEGMKRIPMSLHKYLYGSGNPVTFVDPSGQMSQLGLVLAATIIGTVNVIATPAIAEDAPKGTIKLYVVTDGTLTNIEAAFGKHVQTLRKILDENRCSGVTINPIYSTETIKPPDKGEWSDENIFSKAETLRAALGSTSGENGGHIDVTLTTLPIYWEGTQAGGLSVPGSQALLLDVTSEAEMLAHELGHAMGYRGHPPLFNTSNQSNVMNPVPGPKAHRLDIYYKKLLKSYLGN